MDYMSTVHEKTIDRISEIPRNLLHPRAMGRRNHTDNAHFTSRQVKLLVKVASKPQCHLNRKLPSTAETVGDIQSQNHVTLSVTRGAVLCSMPLLIKRPLPRIQGHGTLARSA